jgi:hypothetical protein
LSLNGSFDTSILLDRGTGVHFFYLPPTKSTKNQIFLVLGRNDAHLSRTFVPVLDVKPAVRSPPMRPLLCRISLTAFAFLLLSFPAAAQSPDLVCVTPVQPATGPCKLKATTNPGQHTVTVQIVDTRRVQDRIIEFTVEEPGRTITENKSTGSDGKATFTWHGAAGTGVKVTAKTMVAGRELTRIIEVQAPDTPGTTQRNLVLVSDSVVYGYEKGQIHAPVMVRIENFGERCESNVVVFKPYGTVGAGSPDSVRATSGSSLGGCTASTWWRLGEGVGRQHLRASISDEPAKSLALNAVARATPRVGAGVVSTYDFRDYDTRNVSERKIQITRRIVDATGDTATVVADSTIKSISVGEVDGGWQTKPTISIDFPFVASLTGLRVSLGAAFESAGRDWYLGMSLLQPFRGVSQEAVGADFHGVLHFGRREVLADSRCDDDGDTSDCKSKEKFFFPLGLGVMATFDASKLLTALANIFP